MAFNKSGNQVIEVDVPIQGRSAFAVTPSNDTDLATKPAALFIGVGGDVVVDMADTGSTITFKNVPSGTFMPILVNRVRATNTTATNIVAVYR